MPMALLRQVCLLLNLDLLQLPLRSFHPLQLLQTALLGSNGLLELLYAPLRGFSLLQASSSGLGLLILLLRLLQRSFCRTVVAPSPVASVGPCLRWRNNEFTNRASPILPATRIRMAGDGNQSTRQKCG